MNVIKLRPFSFYTKKSAAIHSVLVLIMVALSYWQWEKGEEQKKVNIKLVQSSVRVDVVSMPKLTFQELKALQKAGVGVGSTAKSEPEPAPKAKPVPEPDTGREFLKKDDKAQKKPSFADLMKKYSKNKVKEKPNPKKKQAATKPKNEGFDSKTLSKLQGLINRGNKVSNGQALVGTGDAANLTELQAYATQVSNLVRPHWKLPSYLVDKELQCRIKIFIDNRGKLVRSEIFESSGEKEYDSRALNAVKQASPFPAPESLISGRTVRGDILLGFPL